MLSRFRILMRFKPYVRAHWWRIGIAIILSVTAAALKAVIPKLMQYFTDVVLATKNEVALHKLLLFIILYAGVNFLVGFFNRYLIRSAANRFIQSLRNDVYSHLLRLSLTYFGDAQSGALISRVINDVQNIVSSFSLLIDLISQPATFFVLLSYAFFLNWRLPLTTMFAVPLLAI